METPGRAGVTSPGCPHCGVPGEDQGGLRWNVPASGRAAKALRRRRRLRRVRRLFATAVALFLLGGIMFAGLLLVTPSVTNAPVLVRALDRAHHATYPGQPVPGRFAASLLATEDHRFYSEAGLDPFAVVRAGLGYVTGKPGHGGSTLYQRLARILYLPKSSGIPAEAEQTLLGIKLSLSFPKAQILQMYSDVAYFGHGYYGLQAASCGYFGVAPAALTWPQAALLAGLVQAPATGGPLAHLPLARAREASVLSRLVATGTLTRPQAAQAYRQPLHLSAGHTGVRGPGICSDNGSMP